MTGATPQQLSRAVRRWAASGPVYYLNDACQNSRWTVERVAGMLVGQNERIIRLSTLVKVRANLDPIFEYDDQACLSELDALIAGDPR